MGLLVPNQGEAELLAVMVNLHAASDLVLHLFTGNLTPSLTTVVTDALLTEPSGGSGYAAISLTGASWAVATVSTITTATYPLQTFTFTSAVSVYGYYITNTAGTKLMWVERFSGAPYTLPSGGGQIQVQPTINLA